MNISASIPDASGGISCFDFGFIDEDNLAGTVFAGLKPIFQILRIARFLFQKGSRGATWQRPQAARFAIWDMLALPAG
ncbi:MAG TPA: hypothetical protein VN112_16120 [Ensifer sp.]|nr:hypothetical protein [Ensifer sp.]